MFKNTGNTSSKKTREISLKTVFTYIFGALFLIFFLFSGVVTIKAGQLVIGVLYFILAVLVLVPHHHLRVTKTLKFVIFVVLFFVLAYFSGRSTPPVAQKYEYFALGEIFNIAFGNNTFSMVVREAKHDAKISISGKEVTTSGYFIIVTGDIVNLGSEAVDFKFSVTPELKDKQDRRYTLYGTGLAVGKLQPGVAKEVSYVFEIPKDATGLEFIVSDKTDVAKSVDLKR
ncbi:MAG: DUF4352 domain-containing protein [Patescibacteria group bacterium]|nr:DUF4352 domain-containing protein [Patescibacteria group bacterium]MBU1952899.1 DUF4352 domain-containing protein [Patescibacteria group bacterium]